MVPFLPILIATWTMVIGFLLVMFTMTAVPLVQHVDILEIVALATGERQRDGCQEKDETSRGDHRAATKIRYIGDFNPSLSFRPGKNHWQDGPAALGKIAEGHES